MLFNISTLSIARICFLSSGQECPGYGLRNRSKLFRGNTKSLLWTSLFNHIEIRDDHHNKNSALRLVLKERLRGIRNGLFFQLWECTSYHATNDNMISRLRWRLPGNRWRKYWKEFQSSHRNQTQAVCNASPEHLLSLVAWMGFCTKSVLLALRVQKGAFHSMW